MTLSRIKESYEIRHQNQRNKKNIDLPLGFQSLKGNYGVVVFKDEKTPGEVKNFLTYGIAHRKSEGLYKELPRSCNYLKPLNIS